MRLQDIIPLYEFQSPATRDFAKLVNMSNKAYRALSYEARMALDEWETANWDRGRLNASHREQGDIIKEINTAFAPIRTKMRELFGDTIKLHRGQRHFSDEEMSTNRELFSFSFDENVAKAFAHGKPSPDPASVEEIQKAVEQYKRTGFVKFGSRKYKRSKEYPGYFDIYYNNNTVEAYGNSDDELEDRLMRSREYALEYRAEREAKGDVYTIDVPVDKIVWLTNRLNSKEFIVALNPLKK